MEKMRVFTVVNGKVTAGQRVEDHELKNAGLTIKVVKVGEAGRGRKLDVLPVQGNIKDDLIMYASVGQTRSGNPKLFVADQANTNDKCIVVFRTNIGFRGSNSHTGDRRGTDDNGKPTGFLEFPALDILARGVIAQGDAGRAGSGDQLVAVMPRGVVFRTGYGGRLYGAPAAHYYMFDGETIKGVTWEERCATDIF